MIVDTSAIMAIALWDPERDAVITAMLEARHIGISAGSWLELEAVTVRRNISGARAEIEGIISLFDIHVVPVTVEQARIARDAYARYGRGTGHPAHLNLGDCFAYALAKERGEALLFKGDDFARTDVRPAI